jgi:hypothetical protein
VSRRLCRGIPLRGTSPQKVISLSHCESSHSKCDGFAKASFLPFFPYKEKGYASRIAGQACIKLPTFPATSDRQKLTTCQSRPETRIHLKTASARHRRRQVWLRNLLQRGQWPIRGDCDIPQAYGVAPCRGWEPRAGTDDSRRIARTAERRVKAFGTQRGKGGRATWILDRFAPERGYPYSASLIV